MILFCKLAKVKSPGGDSSVGRSCGIRNSLSLSMYNVRLPVSDEEN